jgi:polyisoprenoid-binding protein YceI
MKINSNRVAFCVLALGLGLSANAQAVVWNVDKAHTNVGFSVSHLFTSVQGRFDRFDGTIEFDPENPGVAVVKGTIEAASINTNNEKRDKHLRSPDFFDVEKFPTLSFESTGGIVNSQGKQGQLPGRLTIHGVTKDVVIAVEYLGTAKDPWGNTRAGFRGTITINRKDYGLNWNEALETGGFLVGDEIEIRIDAEGALAD